MAKALRVIIFDLDGTIFDTREDIADAVNYARRYFGKPELTIDEVTSMVGHGIAVLAQEAFEGCGVDTDSAREAIMEYYTANPGKKARLYPGVKETISGLEQVLTVVSNKPKVLVDALLEEHKLAGLFDFVAGGDSFSERKPDPMAVEFILKRYRVTTEEVCVVGDHSPDIEMAKSAGVRSVYCNFGFFGKDSVGADFAIDAWEELPSVLARLMHGAA